MPVPILLATACSLDYRLIIFDSRRVLHEVKPHTRRDVDRLAMTVWIGGAHNAAGFARHCRAWWLGWWPSPLLRSKPYP